MSPPVSPSKTPLPRRARFARKAVCGLCVFFFPHAGPPRPIRASPTLPVISQSSDAVFLLFCVRSMLVGPLFPVAFFFPSHAMSSLIVLGSDFFLMFHGGRRPLVPPRGFCLPPPVRSRELGARRPPLPLCPPSCFTVTPLLCLPFVANLQVRQPVFFFPLVCGTPFSPSALGRLRPHLGITRWLFTLLSSLSVWSTVLVLLFCGSPPLTCPR